MVVTGHEQATLDVESRGLWHDARRRLRANRAAVAGGVYIGLILLVAVCGPLLAPYDPNYIDPATQPSLPPFWIASHDPHHLLGTDSLARDELSRLLYGARISMIVGLVPAALVTAIGTALGLISGWLGGWWDTVLMRLVDVMYAFPTFLFFIILQATVRGTWFGQLLGGLPLLFVAFAVTGWVDLARLVRGQVLSLKEQQYVEAARALGVPAWRILLRHLLPNCASPVIVSVAFAIPSYIMAEAGLSYLGLGVQPPTASWGSMVNDSLPQVLYQPIQAISPAVLSPW